MATLLHFTGIKEKIYSSVPSLEHLAAIKVAIALWNRSDIRILLDKHRPLLARNLEYSQRYNAYRHLGSLPTLQKKWEVINDKVKNCVKELMLHAQLKNKVMSIIKPVGEEISKWKVYHEARFDDSQDYDVRLPAKLYWTAFGTIDRTKTAQALVNDHNVHIDLRYKFACMYCLEQDIAELWNHMPPEYKSGFDVVNSDCRIVWMQLLHMGRRDTQRVNRRGRWKDLQRLWNYAMQGEDVLENMLGIEDHELVSGFLMQQLCFDENEAAVQYFLSKSTAGVKKAFMEAVVAQLPFLYPCSEFEAECFFFVLSLLNEAQQKAVILKPWSAAEILMHCLDWPRQHLFMSIANCLWSFLTDDYLIFVLCAIMHKVKNRYEDYDYQQLFADCWKQSPDVHKQYVIEECATSLFIYLFELGDKRNIRLIWKHATVQQKTNIITSLEKHCRPSSRNIARFKKTASTELWESLFPFLIELVREERRKGHKRKRCDT